MCFVDGEFLRLALQTQGTECIPHTSTGNTQHFHPLETFLLQILVLRPLHLVGFLYSPLMAQSAQPSPPACWTHCCVTIPGWNTSLRPKLTVMSYLDTDLNSARSCVFTPRGSLPAGTKLMKVRPCPAPLFFFTLSLSKVPASSQY